MITVNKKEKLKWYEGMTVQDVLEEMNYDYKLITVSVNEKLVQQEDYATYEVPDNAEVYVFHLVHGG